MKSKKKKPDLTLEALKDEIDELKDTVSSLTSKKTKFKNRKCYVYLLREGKSKYNGMPQFRVSYAELDEDGYSEVDLEDEDCYLQVLVEDAPLDEKGYIDEVALAEYYFTRLKVKN